jgi:hypothetical protein
MINNMRFWLFSSVLFFAYNLSGDQNRTNVGTEKVDNNSPSSAFTADFFAGALADANAVSEDAGKQRLIDVKSTTLSPALSFTTGYVYKNNPDGNSRIDRNRDGDALNASLILTSGLGEYALLDDIVCAPSLMLMQMRTYNDISKDFGTAYRSGNTDAQIVGISFPFVLPYDLIFTIGHTYMRPILLENDNVILYNNTPNAALSKSIPLFSGDTLSLNFSYSYTISKGDTELESLSGFGDTVAQSIANSDNILDPFNLNDTYSYSFSLSYTKPLFEKFTLTPSASVNHSTYVKGSNDGRKDVVYTLGLGSSYKITDWFSVSTVSSFISKETNNPEKTTEFKDFNGGMTLGFNYAF